WALFDAYFSQGRNLTDLNELAQVLQPLGLDRSWVKQHRQLTPTVRAQRQEQQVQWQRMGVQGVPFFIFNQRVAVSGAQPAEVLTQAMAQASEPEKT
ncbi:MAG: DsbA family oxidoreductase, partial [Burkholderiaceae bacterium]